ncbi:MAG: hypothetical protein C0467_23405 [Planctomycetaceae bacterium]|nr:hypothetical protein [Planctomycetaceae bacterium]
MDVQMPKLDGAGAIRAIRQAAPSVRCFLMTGGYYGREQLAQGGADRVFGKPLDVPALLRALADAVACGADEEPRSDRPADREVRADGGA